MREMALATSETVEDDAVAMATFLAGKWALNSRLEQRHAGFPRAL